MRTILIHTAMLLSLSIAASSQVTNCSSYHCTLGPFNFNPQDISEHTTGDHSFVNAMQGHCGYSGTASLDYSLILLAKEERML